MTIDTSMENFLRFGGSDAFMSNISNALFIDSKRVRIIAMREGSVIIDYKILESENDNLE